MLTCDYCGERIDGGAGLTFTALLAPGVPPNQFRLDLHPECVPEFAAQAVSITGKRVKPDTKPTS